MQGFLSSGTVVSTALKQGQEGMHSEPWPLGREVMSEAEAPGSGSKSPPSVFRSHHPDLIIRTVLQPGGRIKLVKSAGLSAWVEETLGRTPTF